MPKRLAYLGTTFFFHPFLHLSSIGRIKRTGPKWYEMDKVVPNVYGLQVWLLSDGRIVKRIAESDMFVLIQLLGIKCRYS